MFIKLLLKIFSIFTIKKIYNHFHLELTEKKICDFFYEPWKTTTKDGGQIWKPTAKLDLCRGKFRSEFHSARLIKSTNYFKTY